jgi:gamma-tubulin complex component 3
VTHYGLPSLTATAADRRGDAVLPFAVSEALLLRDLLFVFQGIDGQYVRYHPPSSCFRLVDAAAATVPHSTRTLVCKLSEVGWLYLKVSQFLQRQAVTEALGKVAQALCAVMQQQLTAYFGEIAALALQLDQDLLTDRGRAAADADSGSGAAPLLTLRRLWVWAQTPLRKLLLLARVCDAVEALRGGAIVGALHLHSVHGDTFVSRFVGGIVTQVCVPVMEMIRCVVCRPCSCVCAAAVTAVSPCLLLAYIFGRSPLSRTRCSCRGCADAGC